MIHHRKFDTNVQSFYDVPCLPTALGVFIPFFGEQKNNHDFTFHNFFKTPSVHFIMEGNGEFTVDGVCWDTKAGDVIILFPDQDVRYRSRSSLWHYFWVRLEGVHAEELLLELGYSKENPHISNGNLAGKLEVFERLKLENDLEYFPRFHSLNILADLMNLIADRLPRIEENLAEKVKRRLENTGVVIPQIQELAEYYKVSRTTLYRAFKNKYGISLKEHIDNSRLEHAAKLLKHSQIPISGVATICGYTTERYFCHAFANKYKLPPGAFRKQN